MPSHWRTVFLRELFEETNSRKGEVSDAFPVLSVLKSGSIVRSEDYFNRSVASRDTSKYKVVEPDCWAYSTIHINEGSIAPNRLGFAGVVSPMYTTMKWNSSSDDSEFWSLRLLSTEMINQYDSFASGTVNRRKSLKFTKFADISVVAPPLVEQRRIVDLVGSIDTYIDSLETQIETTRTARSALLSELLSNPGDDWHETALGKAFDIRMGRQRSPKNASGTHMVSYLRAANVKDGELLLADVKQMNFSPDEQATFRLEPGDVLVTEGCGSREEVGASAQWNSEVAGVVCFQNTLLRMRQVDGTTTTGFAEVVARYFYSSGRWADVASGTNIFHIGANRAVAMPFDLPPLAEQRRIVDLVGSFDEQISSLESQVESVRALRSGVLSELLSGERLLDESYDVAVGL